MSPLSWLSSLLGVLTLLLSSTALFQSRDKYLYLPCQELFSQRWEEHRSLETLQRILVHQENLYQCNLSSDNSQGCWILPRRHNIISFFIPKNNNTVGLLGWFYFYSLTQALLSWRLCPISELGEMRVWTFGRVARLSAGDRTIRCEPGHWVCDADIWWCDLCCHMSHIRWHYLRHLAFV